VKICVLHSRIRLEEKMLLAELDRRKVDYDLVHVERTVFPFEGGGAPEKWAQYDAVLERCISHSQALEAMRILESWGIPCVNHAHVGEICGDKLATNLALNAAGVPVPKARVAFGFESAIAAVEELGYPAVIKPATGSWGRLIARVNDRDAAEALIEHKQILGTYHHSTFYVQQHIDKPGRDLRGFVVGDDVICAIQRNSGHWITNTARGASTEAFPVTDELRELSHAAAKAVGGGIVAVDLLETKDGEMLVNDVNYTMEFKNSVEPTGVDIPAHIIGYLIDVGEGKVVTQPRRPAVALNPIGEGHGS
jgi:[lysine-biosynthesis-protein LysW]--L-2-aminoadipate ligase